MTICYLYLLSSGCFIIRLLLLIGVSFFFLFEWLFFMDELSSSTCRLGILNHILISCMRMHVHCSTKFSFAVPSLGQQWLLGIQLRFGTEIAPWGPRNRGLIFHSLLPSPLQLLCTFPLWKNELKMFSEWCFSKTCFPNSYAQCSALNV